jgi:hypothetical protein
MVAIYRAVVLNTIPLTLVHHQLLLTRVRVIVFNTTFNNISVTLWWSVLLVEETRVPGENHRPVTDH